MKSTLQNNLKKILIICCCCYFLNTGAQTVTTFAGSTSGFTDGIGTEAQFSGPAGLAVATDGTVFVADWISHCIRKITAAGVVTTFAGSIEGYADGTGTAALFSYPMSLAVDLMGNVYVADTANHRIRKITPAGVVTTLAGSTPGFGDGTRTAAKFNYPEAVAVDAAGTVYVADTANHSIRKITPDGNVSTLAGNGTPNFADGTGSIAKFWSPSGIAVDATGTVFVSEKQNNRIRKITPAGVVTTLAGDGTSDFADGTGTTAKFATPFNLAVDAAGNIYVADSYNNRIRKVTPAGVVTTLAGNGIQGYADGTALEAKFKSPIGISIAPDGTIFVGDTSNYRIRRITNALATPNYQLENQISVYPNPASTLVNLELDDLAGAKITLFDINGRVLQSENNTNSKTAINISNLTNGVYVMQIMTSKGTVCKKIVKE